jgi:hypothetical protein
MIFNDISKVKFLGIEASVPPVLFIINATSLQLLIKVLILLITLLHFFNVLMRFLNFVVILEAAFVELT